MRVQFSGDHEEEEGRWLLEAGFGRIDDPNPRTFADLGKAQGWIEQRLAPVS